MGGGAVEIEREILEHDGHAATDDEDGWSDLAWVQYMRHAPASEQKLSGDARTRDKGRDGLRLADFAEHAVAKRAALSEAEVLSLRLYTSSVGRSINAPLHAGCTPSRPHPLPALVGHLVAALAKLRATAREPPTRARAATSSAARATLTWRPTSFASAAGASAPSCPR